MKIAVAEKMSWFPTLQAIIFHFGEDPEAMQNLNSRRKLDICGNTVETAFRLVLVPTIRKIPRTIVFVFGHWVKVQTNAKKKQMTIR